MKRRTNPTDFVQAQSQIVAALGQPGHIDETQRYIKRVYEIEPKFDARKLEYPLPISTRLPGTSVGWHAQGGNENLQTGDDHVILPSSSRQARSACYILTVHP